MDFSADTVTDLKGQSGTVYGITKGYAAGTLTFYADKWNGSTNDGEFSISGDGFTTNARSTVTKSYFFGRQRVAMRQDALLTYLHGDHLGSASLSTDASGGKTAEMRYYPYGERRSGGVFTDRRYTGQREEAGLGLYDYNARYYDPALGRFLQADTIVPSPANPQSLNRYAYVLNNPLRYTDPSGHTPKKSGGAPPINVQSYPFFNGKVIYDSVTYTAGTNGVLRNGKNPTGALLADLGGLALGTGSMLCDVAEMGNVISFEDELISATDVTLAVWGSLLQGETYIGKPHPDLPVMTVIGQDVVVAGTDLIIGLLADTLGVVLAVPTEGISLGVSETVFEIPSLLSFLYDIGRLLDKIPTEGALAYYRDDQGILHIVTLDYVPADAESETIELGTQ